MASLTLKAGDAYPDIDVTFTQEGNTTTATMTGGVDPVAAPTDGTAIDLTDLQTSETGTVKMRMASAAVTVTPVDASITSAADGQVSVALSASDTATAGTYNVEFELDWDGEGEIQTIPNTGYNTIEIEDTVAES